MAAPSSTREEPYVLTSLSRAPSIIDTGVLIRLERDPATVDFSAYKVAYGEGFISAATCSEPLVGVHLANTKQRKARRSAFVEAVFTLFHPLPFDLEVARVHARLVSSLGRGITIGAFDLIIGATAIRHGFPVLTTNASDFRRMPGCDVELLQQSGTCPWQIGGIFAFRWGPISGMASYGGSRIAPVVSATEPD
jgi:tRNA(fMet)-specific endonuclease VapC